MADYNPRRLTRKAARSATTGQQIGRAAAIRLIAENQLRRYDSEFDADHLSWVDFESDAREDIDALATAGLLRTAPEPSGDVVETVARAICNVGQDMDLWGSDQLGWSTREDIRAEARAAIAAMRGEQ